MNYRDFVCWLQGYLELSGERTFDRAQVKIIQAHLNQATNNGTEWKEVCLDNCENGGDGGC